MRARTDHGYVYLDLVRGLAALTVFAGHLRNFLFDDFSGSPKAHPFYTLFYFLTGFGHQAVVIFFVLSGFLIGKSVIAAGQAGRWSWRDYAIKRVSRLWIVLVPALLLTAALDFAGRHYLDGAVYDGSLYRQYHSGPSVETAGVAYSAVTFLCNLLFLQTIAAPTFGSNAPLWSLANEFWYYVLFPLFFFGLRHGTTLPYRILFLAVAGALCLWLPWGLVAAGLVWLFGVLVSVLQHKILPGPTARTIWIALSLILFAGVLTLARFNTLPASDFVVGMAFAILMMPLTWLPRPGRIVAAISTFLGSMSYTLYLIHFPIAAFLAAGLMHGRRMSPGIHVLALYFALFLSILAVARGVYLLFEKQTGRVQKALLRTGGVADPRPAHGSL